MHEPTESYVEPWWQSAVVYQVYPRSFQDSNGDGIGDIPGITSRLDYLAALGVDVIWLSPVYQSPQVDNGYDISDYHSIAPEFGTLSDLDVLVREAHSRGLRVILDLVVNHTSNVHEWFVESRSPLSNYRDWYFWRPAREGSVPGTPGAEPFTLPAAFASAAWNFDKCSGEYYLGLFGPAQPDLNWANPNVRNAVYSMMRWWVARGIDGFRMDVINMIAKSDALTSGRPIDPNAKPQDLLADFDRLEYYLSEMNQEAGLGDLDLMTVGEMPGVTVELARRVTDPANRELNMVFSFEHVSLADGPGGKFDPQPTRLSALKENLAKWQYGLERIGWNSLYFDNHDQPRAVSSFGDDSPAHRSNSAKTLATVLHMHKGTPYIYQGEELGMTSAEFTTIDQYRDVESLNHYRLAREAGVPESVILEGISAKGRDNARTPVQWDTSQNAGFTTATPWIAVNSNHKTINARDSVRDPSSVFAHFQKLIQLRHDSELVRQGRFNLLIPDHEQLWAFTRVLDAGSLLILANCSSLTAAIPSGIPPSSAGRLILGTHGNPDPKFLQPWESRVILLKGRM